jgi:hypothetical protein
VKFPVTGTALANNHNEILFYFEVGNKYCAWFIYELHPKNLCHTHQQQTLFRNETKCLIHDVMLLSWMNELGVVEYFLVLVECLLKM